MPLEENKNDYLSVSKNMWETSNLIVCYNYECICLENQTHYIMEPDFTNNNSTFIDERAQKLCSTRKIVDVFEVSRRNDKLVHGYVPKLDKSVL